MDDPSLGSRPAHVERDRIFEAERTTERLRADDAGRGPRFEHVHAVVLGLLGLVEPTGRLHDQERAVETVGADMVLDLADVAAHDRPYIGVGDHGRAALELTVFLGELVRRRHEHLRVIALQDRFGARLVPALGVAVEEQDRGRLDAASLQQAPEARDLILVERRLDLAVGEHAFFDLEAQRALDQRFVLLEEQIVRIGPVDPADLVDVAEAVGDEQRSPRALALQDGVDRDGRAMQEQPGRAVVAPGLGDARIDALDQPLRRRQHFAEAELAGAIVEHGNVGEGAADVGGETKAAAGAAQVARGDVLVHGSVGCFRMGCGSCT